ncbi:MAG: hypothetical protein HOM93_03230 [Candidatus Marinimicrobia bacterium]|nr:hypothetical protein [Candidatus Neomarinimicrobiota bacterium]
MNEIHNLETIADRKSYGGKAFWISWLKHQGFNVPHTVFVPINYLYSKRSFSEIYKEYGSNNINSETRFAARSSSIDEDDSRKSQAGTYTSITNLLSLESVVKKIPVIQKSGKNVGVVIQRYIIGEYSGVIFSTCPNTGNRNSIVVNYIAGNSEDLLDGTVIGDELNIQFSECQNREKVSTESDIPCLNELIQISKDIESLLGYPVDIEWCVEKNTNRLFILQCRPITNLKYEQSRLVEINEINKKYIPQEIMQNEKVQIRLKMSCKNVPFPKAYLLLMNHADYQKYDIATEISKKVPMNPQNLGFRQILTTPPHIEGNVVRMFSENTMESLTYSLNEMQRIGFQKNWQTAIIFHELYALKYMGIVKKIQNGYLIEVSWGGFIQKGVTESSQYRTNQQYKVLKKNENIQTKEYTILKGNIVDRTINKKIVLPEQSIETIIKSFFPLLQKELAVEFGIPTNAEQSTPYLIDYLEDSTKISVSNVDKGVVSKGKVTGSICHLHGGSEWQKSIQMHFYDSDTETPDSIIDLENLIFVVDKPYISLVAILEKYNSRNIGFIFRQASILSHFCILLREKRIPAIVSNSQYSENELSTINA